MVGRYIGVEVRESLRVMYGRLVYRGGSARESESDVWYAGIDGWK